MVLWLHPIFLVGVNYCKSPSPKPAHPQHIWPPTVGSPHPASFYVILRHLNSLSWRGILYAVPQNPHPPLFLPKGFLQAAESHGDRLRLHRTPSGPSTSADR